MKALLIIAAVILIFFCLLQIPLKLRASYLGGAFSLRASVAFVTVYRRPKKPKRRSLRYYSLKNIRRREKKAALEAQKPKKKKKKTGGGAGASEVPSEGAGVSEVLKFLKEFAGKIIGLAKKYLRVDLVKLCVTAASDDPARTAVLYGALTPVFLGLHELLTSVKNFRLHRNTHVSLHADFTAAKPSAEIDLTFSVRAWQAIAIAGSLLLEYVRRAEKQEKTVNRAASAQTHTGG